MLSKFPKNYENHCGANNFLLVQLVCVAVESVAQLFGASGNPNLFAAAILLLGSESQSVI